MPKVEIDYSNTIIYKITCNDSNITDVYVGHTTNFVQRKHAHKDSCANAKSSNYKCKLYETIRCNGGWSNWKMEIINFFNCADHYGARKKEQEYFVLLNANLNSIEPLPKPKIKTKPILDKKEKQLVCSKSATKFTCDSCEFKTSNKKDYKRHELTAKHHDICKKITNYPNFTPIYPKFSCLCGNIYTYNSGLSRHKKICQIETVSKCNVESDSGISKKDLLENNKLVEHLIKENAEFKSLIMELIKKDTTAITSDK